MENSYFAAGCFWGPQATFDRQSGVTETCVGYQGGSTLNPSYEQVCSGRTGHAEVVSVTFDPALISYAALLEIFWKIHDPTTLNRQGPDRGTQYRSAIFAVTPQQKAAAIASRDALAQSGKFPGKIVTEIVMAPPFYPAEDYHQQYFARRGMAHMAGN